MEHGSVVSRPLYFRGPELYLKFPANSDLKINQSGKTPCISLVWELLAPTYGLLVKPVSNVAFLSILVASNYLLAHCAIYTEMIILLKTRPTRAMFPK